MWNTTMAKMSPCLFESLNVSTCKVGQNAFNDLTQIITVHWPNEWLSHDSTTNFIRKQLNPYKKTTSDSSQ